MIAAREFLQARILIVDDQTANVRLLERLLSSTGYTEVHSTTDPCTVGALHRANRYSLILLDLQMPGMDGFEVMEVLLADADDDYLPVIVLTAQPAHKLRALQAGARDFIAKPFELAEVRSRIHNLLEVRLLYEKLENRSEALEQAVQERTAELRESEARFRALTSLASDWYWEQNETGHLTHVSGPVQETLGVGFTAFLHGAGGDIESSDGTGWNEVERVRLQSMIAARQPFLDFSFSRVAPDGAQRRFRVSGEPMFGPACRYIGYRGIGAEITAGN